LSTIKPIKAVLVGNPNTGKTSLFNQLTGLNQKVGNYPGITIDKKIGSFKTKSEQEVKLIDLPGTYSLYPRSKDEEVVINMLSNPLNVDYPDVVLVVSDAINIRRNLLVFSQIKDLGIPTILIVNMIDAFDKDRADIDLKQLEENVGVKVVGTDARKGFGINDLKELIEPTIDGYEFQKSDYVFNQLEDGERYQLYTKAIGIKNTYLAWHWYVQNHLRNQLSDDKKTKLEDVEKHYPTEINQTICEEIVARYKAIDAVIDNCTVSAKKIESERSVKLDKIVLHNVFGYVSIAVVLLLVFQAIFSWSVGPMDWVDLQLSTLGSWIGKSYPDNFVTSLLSQGIIPGIAGVVIFIPQIALLFFFIALLEESGYMARVVFLMDKLLRPFGLNGKSVVPLISGFACAIPAIMSTRSIGNWKERLTTILVIPLMTCSARIPVYTILIALIVPRGFLFGIFSYQALSLMLMYLIGTVTSLVAAFWVKKILPSSHESYLLMELPDYRMPRWQNVGLTIWEKTKAFIMGAGKIILAISVLLWLLSAFGPTDKYYHAETIVTAKYEGQNITENELNKRINSYRLEKSFIGAIGKTIEPAIKPLGYDWKVGIALITSFAAREVFVGTMATIYSLDDDGDQVETIKQKMNNDIDPATGKSRFNVASSISLLLFYAFAMQCLSTLAIVQRETKSWKWPLIQLVSMTGFAYLISYIAYQLLK
jgi:ferrous iron transport protein B